MKNKKQYQDVQKEYSSKIGQNISAGTVDISIKNNEFSQQALNHLPENIVNQSFGCGNPLAFADLKKGETVVDLGCGAGMDLLLAAEVTGPTGKVVGVDMTQAMLERARKNIKAANLEKFVEVREGFIENLPVDTETADFVISNCVVSLSPNKSKVFAEVFRILKPQGRMQISDLVVDKIPQWIRFLVKLVSPASAKGILFEQEYIQHIKNSGLENVEVIGRFAYDKDMIEHTINRELNTQGLTWCKTLPETKKKCLFTSLKPCMPLISKQLENKIFSIKVFAHKAA